MTFNYGSSSQLATQLTEGAPADIFASANAKQMQVAQDAGRIEGDPQIFLTNKLVVIVPIDNPAGIQTLADLAKPGVKLVLAAAGVPVRDYTDQMIEKLVTDSSYGQAYSDAFYKNVVSEEDNVRQVTAKIALGEGDAALVYTSDVTPDIESHVMQIEVPDDFNVVAQYPIGAVKGSEHADLAAAFIEYVLSADGQAILAKWGFGPAPTN
jgi:molybdate transport system substrate-binding protein